MNNDIEGACDTLMKESLDRWKEVTFVNFDKKRRKMKT